MCSALAFVTDTRQAVRRIKRAWTLISCYAFFAKQLLQAQSASPDMTRSRENLLFVGAELFVAKKRCLSAPPGTKS